MTVHTHVRTLNGESLTEEQFKKFVPSVYAGEAHESRSDRYTYIPTIDILREMYRHGFQPVEARQARTRTAGKRDFTKHMVKLRHKDRAFIVGDIIPEITLVNAHDGSSSYEFFGGLFRPICTNGMVASEGFAASVRIPHKGDVLDDVIDGSFTVLGETQRLTDFADQTRRIRMSQDDIREYGNLALKVMGKEKELNWSQVTSPRRAGDGQANLWHVFQRTQENAIKGGLLAQVEKEVVSRGRRVVIPATRSTRAVNGIDGNIDLNQKLWGLTVEFAKMKELA